MQEAVSSLTATNLNAYEETNGFAIYGVEWMTGPDGYITWFSDGKPSWSINPSAMGQYVIAEFHGIAYDSPLIRYSVYRT